MATEVTVRKAEVKDCSGIASLIKELAVFEKMPEEAKLTAADLERDGFTSNPPLFRCLLAEQDGKLIGMTLYYFIYSTWKGKCIYLEDFYVTPDSRNKEVGSRLFRAVVQAGLEAGCQRLDFEVLSWNPARRFYDRKGAVNVTEAEDWHKYRMDRKTMEKLVSDA